MEKENENEVDVFNPFDALEDEDDYNINKVEEQNSKESTKERVN